MISGVGGSLPGSMRRLLLIISSIAYFPILSLPLYLSKPSILLSFFLEIFSLSFFYPICVLHLSAIPCLLITS